MSEEMHTVTVRMPSRVFDRMRAGGYIPGLTRLDLVADERVAHLFELRLQTLFSPGTAAASAQAPQSPRARSVVFTRDGAQLLCVEPYDELIVAWASLKRRDPLDVTLLVADQPARATIAGAEIT